MSRIVVLNGRRMLYIAGTLALLIAGFYIIRYGFAADLPSFGPEKPVRTIHIVTAEVKGTTANGKKLEAYRWDPGNIYVNKGEKVRLSLTGISGHSHPFSIEGTTIRGEVRQGKETVVDFQADKAGVYRLICHTHPSHEHNGPMIGYIIVQ